MNVLENRDLTKEDISIYRGLEDVVSALRRAKDENINVNLLIGAGCSVTANIPAAQGMVDTIKNDYPGEFKRAKIKDYPNCMSKLTPSERKNLISQTVKNAKINWTHIAIAQLLKNGYINRILTPNFDNLVQRACALVGEFPGIYDLTTSSEFKKDLLFDKSVIHLHGQHTGFILCNTEKEVENQFQTLKPIFQQLDEKSLWIVIGYSGNNDPIFKLLSNKTVFEHRLFWIGYEDNEPSKMLKAELLSEDKYTFFIKGYNSDDFFVRLSQQLDCFPPAFIHKPFTYLSETLDTLAPYKISTRHNATEKNRDIDNSNALHILTKNVVQKAITNIENDKALMAQHYFMAGLFDETIKLATNISTDTDLGLEFQVINALREKGELQVALDRLYKLNNVFPNNYKIHHELASLTFIIGVPNCARRRPEEIELRLLKIPLDLFEESYNLSPSADSLTQWEVHLIIMHQHMYEIKHTELHTFLSESINKYLKSLNDFKQNGNTDGFHYSGLFTIASAYINSKNFEYARFILESVPELNFSILCKAEILATWGRLYFRNDCIDFNISLKNGIDYYTKALEHLEEISEFDDGSYEYNKFKQEFLFEHAKFLLGHEQQKDYSITLLNECIHLGVHTEFNNGIQKKAISLLEALYSQNTVLSK
ncbi:hypothetical protein [Bacillus mycoides]|uniref:hypothetical protein n=1 Tax=Bacillus mycoides TaxID=1405 RepID=UPI001E5A2C52|nr:hypothetical protein [Bacillus mycoides]